MCVAPCIGKEGCGECHLCVSFPRCLVKEPVEAREREGNLSSHCNWNITAVFVQGVCKRSIKAALC